MDPVVISPWSPAIWSSSLIILCFFLWSWYPWRVLTSDFAEFSSILILLMSSHDWTKVLCIPGNQFSSVAQSCPALCDPRNCSTPGLPVHHQLPEFTQTHVYTFSDIRISQKVFRKDKLSSNRIHFCYIILSTEFKLGCLLCNHQFWA